MDGVLYHGNRLLPDVPEFVEWLKTHDKKFLFLTNSSAKTPRELQQKMARLGIDIGEEHFYTSALATAAFLSSQCPNGSAFVIGDAGIVNALYSVGYSMNDVNPDYVVVSESNSYSYERITNAINLVCKGARLIGTNPDVTGPVELGIVPGTGALVAPIEMATGNKAYFVGKPNPFMMRNALKILGCRREETVIIGDRMDTDILAGIEAEIRSILVLSGVTSEEDIERFAYRPDYVLKGVGGIFRE
jgi:NagD protein